MVASNLLSAAEETQKEDVTCSEGSSEATRGNSDSHNMSNVIEIECSSTSASH